MTHEYTPVSQLAPRPPQKPSQKPPQRRNLGHAALYRLEQLFGATFALVAFAAAVVAVLTYFNILPPQLLPLADWIQQNIFRR
jgi:hypothetical protein